MNGYGQRERREDDGQLFRGLLGGLHGSFLCLNGGQRAGELRVAQFFSVGGLLNSDVNFDLMLPISIRSCGRLGPAMLGVTVPRSRRTTWL